jgi:hypothetical protein
MFSEMQQEWRTSRTCREFKIDPFYLTQNGNLQEYHAVVSEISTKLIQVQYFSNIDKK